MCIDNIRCYANIIEKSIKIILNIIALLSSTLLNVRLSVIIDFMLIKYKNINIYTLKYYTVIANISAYIISI